MILRGKIVPGFSGAAGSIKKQKPFLQSYIPDISSVHDGTINVQLESPLFVREYDIETPPIEWVTGFWEIFRIIRARIQLCPCEPSFGNAIPCLLYFAEASPHHFNPYLVEVVTKELVLTDVKECFIFLTKPCCILVGDKRVF